MSFLRLDLLFVLIPLLAALEWLRVRRRNYWSNSVVELMQQELDPPNPLLQLPRFLETVALAFLILAILQPVYPATLQQIERVGYQFLFVLDLSVSMETEDMSGTRLPREVLLAGRRPVRGVLGMQPPEGSKLRAIKRSAMEFVGLRDEDSFGLVVFSNNGYLVVPPIYDHDTLRQYIDMIGAHSISNEGFTAIGEGLATANEFFDRQDAGGLDPKKGRIIILLTDGDSNFGRQPNDELRHARSKGRRIYYLGFALKENSSRILAATVSATGGRYFDVRNPNHLQQAFAAIDQTEKGRFQKREVQRNLPAFAPFVLTALGCLALRMLANAVPHFVDLS